MQAAVLLEKIAIFAEEFQLRQIVAERYQDLLQSTHFKPPYVDSDNQSAYAQFTIRVTERERIQESLRQKGIPTAVHYPSPLHLQPVFAELNYQEGDFPQAELAAKSVLSLPMHPYLTHSQQIAIVDALKNCQIMNQSQTKEPKIVA